MTNFFDQIKAKITEKINPENIILIDNTSLHAKHKFFDENKFHVKIIIKSKKLKNMNKIVAHKKIFSILKEEMNTKIHALEIVIE
jgi:BolA family transcriptional regulator, general stress-responsive regulator|tara:strand:+ start:460 stop:714 length:255 start_codon:yes stop_codon:yes gene_type:complete